MGTSTSLETERILSFFSWFFRQVRESNLLFKHDFGVYGNFHQEECIARISPNSEVSSQISPIFRAPLFILRIFRMFEEIL